MKNYNKKEKIVMFLCFIIPIIGSIYSLVKRDVYMLMICALLFAVYTYKYMN